MDVVCFCRKDYDNLAVKYDLLWETGTLQLQRSVQIAQNKATLHCPLQGSLLCLTFSSSAGLKFPFLQQFNS